MWRVVTIVLFCLAAATTAAADERLRYLFAGLAEAVRARNESEAFQWTLQIAAHSKDPYWRYRVGDHYWRGSGVAADPEAAVTWYRSAAVRGNTLGMLALARALFHGRGAARDVDDAMRWLARASHRGMVRAYFELASHHLHGTAILAIPERAEDLIARGLETAANQARQSAKIRRKRVNAIGEAYLIAGDSFGCSMAAPRDLGLAVRFWIMAASEGEASAWSRLRRIVSHEGYLRNFCRF